MAEVLHKMRRPDSKRSYSGWFDGDNNQKVTEMDQKIKQMLRLIEEDADSFAKRAEMYYKKRPELVAIVEDFYHMYRSLAERYDNLIGEKRKIVPTGRRSSHQAADYNFFSDSVGGKTDVTASYSSGSESESDGASSKEEGLRRRIVELEAKLVEVKEKLCVADKENSDALSRVAENGNYDELLGCISWYDEELKVGNERLRLSEEEILKLRADLQSEQSHLLNLQEHCKEFDAKFSVSVDKIESLEAELNDTRTKLKASDEEIRKLKLEMEKNNISQGKCDVETQPPRYSNNRGILFRVDNNMGEELEDDSLALEKNEIVLGANMVLEDELTSARNRNSNEGDGV